MPGWGETTPQASHPHRLADDDIPPSMVSKFAEAYISNGENATQAYYQAINPNASHEVAMSAGCRWKNHSKVMPLIEKLRRETMEKAGITQERITEELARIAFLDLGELFDENGRLLPMNAIPEDARRAIAGMDVDQIGEEIIRTKYKLESKTKALELLGRWQKMFTDKVEHDVSDDLAASIRAARKRVRTVTTETVEEADILQ